MQDRGWKPLIICPSGAEARRIRSLLVELGVDDSHVLSEYPSAGSFGALAAQRGGNICFLEIASQPDQALALIGPATAVMPVVAVHPQKDADLILKCLRLGACEFLSEPSLEQMSDLLTRLIRVNAPADSRKKSLAVAVIPGKSGSGASTLATYLAIEMKRAGAERVLLVDTDPLCGNVAFLLRLKAAYHFGDAIRDGHRMDEDLWARLVSHCHGIDVLPAPEDPTTRFDLDRQAASGLLAFWRKHYDVMVFDIAAAGAPGVEFAPLSDALLLVTTSDLSGVHASQRSLEWLQKNSVDKTKIKTVISRYAPALGLKREEVEAALKAAPYALLRHDWDAIQEALLDGKPIGNGSSFGIGVRTLAERLLGREKATKKKSSFFGLLAMSRPFTQGGDQKCNTT